MLLLGLTGLGAEVAKNIILAGIKSIVLLDPSQVTEEDQCSQFLVAREDVGKNVSMYTDITVHIWAAYLITYIMPVISSSHLEPVLYTYSLSGCF